MPVSKQQLAEARQRKEARRKAALSESLAHAAQFDASQQRKADIAANDTGVPLDVATNNLAEVEAYNTSNSVDVDRLRSEAPATAEWLENPVNARVARDDLEILEAMERYTRNIDRVNTPLNLSKNVAASVSRAGGDTIEAFGHLNKSLTNFMRGHGVKTPEVDIVDGKMQWAWSDEVNDEENFAQSIGRMASDNADAYWGTEQEYTLERMKQDPGPANVLGFILETFAGSAAETAGAVVNPVVILPAVLERLAEGRAENSGDETIGALDLLKQLPAAATVIALDRLGGRAALGLLDDAAGKVTVPFIAKELVKKGLLEGTTEVVQEEIEYASEALGTPVGMNWQEAGDRALGAAVGGGGIGVGFRSLSLVGQGLQNKVEESIVRNIDSLNEQADIDGMIEAQQNSRLFQESPERAVDYLRNMAGDDKFYITPEEVAAAAEEGLPVPKYMVDAAQGSADVEVSLDNFAMDVMTSDELLTRLRPHLKRTANSYTQSEIQNRDTSSIDKILDNVLQTKEVRSEAETVFDEVSEQLVATGRMSPEAAKHNAAIIPAVATTIVSRMKARGKDITVAEVYEKMNFTVKGPTKKTPEPTERTAPKPKTGTRLQQEQQIIENQTIEAVQGTAIVEPETGTPIKLYVEPDIESEASDAEVTPTYLTPVPPQEGSQEGSYVNIKNPMIVDGDSRPWDEKDLQDLQDQGYDGVWEKRADGDRVIAFDPQQVQTVPEVELDTETNPVVQQIDQDTSTFQKLLACAQAA